MRYKGKVYRPPSEAYSLIIQVTYGCSHNRCAFCDMYDDKRFALRPMEEIREDFRLARQVYRRVERVFLADGDALMRKTDELLEILAMVYSLFPECQRVTCYASPRSLQVKTEEELRRLREGGLKMVTAISGLGSRELLREHAVDTARALSAMNPEYIGLLTLMVEPGTPLERWVREGSFQVLGPAEILQETALLLDHMDSPGSVFRMNHASNYLTLKGTLNRDLPALRQQVQEGLMGHGLRPESWRAL